jgi:hypothetical protein
MSLIELLRVLQHLRRADKLRMLQFLVLELPKDEGTLLTPEMSYPMWPPSEAIDAAAVLLDVLERGWPSEHA